MTDIDPERWQAPNATVIGRSYITDMDGINLKQWDYIGDSWNMSGCSPTAASNLIWFWAKKRGYTLLDPYGNQQDIALRLRLDMGTYQLADGTGETPPLNIAPGLRTYAQRYYPAASTSHYLMGSYSTAQNEILNGRPLLLNMKSHPYFNEGHTVTVVGYKFYQYCTDPMSSCTNDEYLVIRNNFRKDHDANGNLYDTHNLYLAFRSWSWPSWSMVTLTMS